MRHASRAARILAPLVGAACLLMPAAAAWADPPGNNGTTKVGEIEVEVGKANDPHVDCVYEIRFFDFDEGQSARITFSIHPPSGRGTVLLSETVEISDDAAGGGQDEDAVLVYDGADLGLGDFTAHPKQGYHVKLDILSEGVPGGQKHKVFWLTCKEKCPPKTY